MINTEGMKKILKKSQTQKNEKMYIFIHRNYVVYTDDTAITH